MSLSTGRVKESERQREKKRKRKKGGRKAELPPRPSRWCLASNYSNVSDGSFTVTYVLKGEYEKGF